VADALSRRDAEHAQDDTDGRGAMCVQSGPTFAFLDDVRRATAQVPEAQDMLHHLGAGELQAPWRFADGLLLHGSRIVLPDHGDLRRQALSLAHSGGHEGVKENPPSPALRLLHSG
jgi:hypothetical protein